MAVNDRNQRDAETGEDEEDPFVPPPVALLNLPLNPQHFYTFLAVADAGGRLSAAAPHVGLSQPAISHQLSQLEQRLNVRLFDRARGRAARMTRAGRVFERYAREIVQLQTALYADLEQMGQRLGGHLRVGSSPGPGEHWLPPLLLAFREQFPDVHIELHVSDARSIVEQVFANELELGFAGARWARAGLEFEPVYTDEFVLITSPTHPLAKRSRVRMRELGGQDFIAQEPGTGLRLALEQELAERDLTLQHFNVLAELGNQESVAAAVRAGYGIGCVWRGSVELEVLTGAVEVLPVEDFEPDANFYAVRRAHRRLSRRGRALLDFVRKEGVAAQTESRRARKRSGDSAQ
jgi:DNA-binding transcriptional LysR family regulator